MEIVEIRNFGIALLIGALAGVEREMRRASDGGPGVGGIRTFILISMMGALCAWITLHLATSWVFVAGFLAVAGVMISSHILEAREHPGAVGLTTEVGAIVVYLLAGTVMFGYPELAVALAISTSAIMAFKQPIHGLIDKIGRDDLYAVLKLLIASFIVLPLLPDRAIDPLHAFNPYKVWLLVILISGLSLVGYIAVRVLGEESGTAVTGLTGGLVSSTAVTLHFARESREDGGVPARSRLYAASTMLAWTVMFVRVIVAVAVVNAALLTHLWIPFAAMGATALAFGAFYYYSTTRQLRSAKGGTGTIQVKNPFSLTSAIKFAIIFAVVLFAVAFVQRYAPPEGVYFVAGLAGLTDVDAITLTMASDAKTTGDYLPAVAAIVIAVLANTLTKFGFFLAFGSPTTRQTVGGATVCILAAGALSLFFI
jgi:uncharacterized membrane protein (DUF4010 family)